MKRNTIFGSVSLLVAGAAIGAGVVASGNAMAGDSEPPSDENTIEVINATVGADGKVDAFSCTLEGVELPTVAAINMDELQPFAGEPGTEGAPTAVYSIGADGELTLDSLPDGVEAGQVQGFGQGGVSVSGTVVAPADGSGLPAISGEFTVTVGLPATDDGELQLVDPADVRKGSPEECAGLQAPPASVDG